MEMNLDYNEFAACMAMEMEKRFGGEFQIRIQKVWRNNDVLEEVLTVKGRKGVFLGISLKGFYAEYQKGASFEEIAARVEQKQKMIEGIQQKVKNSGAKIDDSYFKKNVIFWISNYERNQEHLKGLHYKRFLDLAVVYECVLHDETDPLLCLPVTPEITEAFGISDEEPERCAVQNTQKMFPPKLTRIEDVISEYMGQQLNAEESLPDKADMELPEMGGNCPSIYVLTNSMEYRGASCILYENCLDDVAESTGGDFFLCPSSIHETIIIQKEDGMDTGKLRDIVREINHDMVDVKEILSN